jgi:hypothetical protein
MQQHFLLLSVTTAWASIWYLLRKHGVDGSKTVSGHAAATSRYHIRFAAVEIVIALTSWLFVERWYVPAYDLGPNFRIIAALSSVGLIVAAIIPQKQGWRFIVHEAAAYTMAFGLLGQLGVFLAEASVVTAVKLLFAASCIYMGLVWILLIFFQKYTKNITLHLQLGYFLTYHLCLLVTTYI